MKAKKIFKGMTAAAVAAVLAASMVPMTAFAAGDCTVSIGNPDAVTNLSGYNVYKVANVTPNGNAYDYSYTDSFAPAGSTLATEYPLETTVAGYSGNESGTTAGDADGVQKYANKLANIVAIANSNGDADDDIAAVETVTGKGSVTLGAGYYLIVPNTTDSGIIAAPSLIVITNDTAKTFNIKTSKITFDKTIASINGSNTKVGKDDNATANKTGSVSVGDKVIYDLTAQIPDYSSELKQAIEAGDITFETPFAIYDTPNAGLTVDTTSAATLGLSVKLIDGASEDTIASDNYELITTDSELDGAKFAVKFKDNYIVKHPGKKVKVSFDAVVNDNAVVGTDATDNNLNTSKLKYSNQYATGKGSAEIESKAKVYTAQLKVFKYTKEQVGDEMVQKPLAGAGFTLYVANTLDDGTVINVENDNYRVDTNGLIYAKSGANQGKICNKKVGDEKLTTAGNNATITFDKIAEGTYVVVETTVPADYKQAAAQQITITDKDADGIYDGVFAYSGATTTDTLDVENTKGSTLPGTGGMGTIVFTAAGAGVVLVAGIMLVIYIKKRKIEE